MLLVAFKRDGHFYAFTAENWLLEGWGKFAEQIKRLADDPSISFTMDDGDFVINELVKQIGDKR